MWSVMVEECEELGGVDWEWQAADCALGKARLGGTQLAPIPRRGKAGSKRSLLVEGDGSLVVAEPMSMEATLAAIVVERPQPTGHPRPMSDKGYDNPTGHQAAAAHGYQAHIRRIGEEKLDSFGEKTHPARRWVVERTLSWLSKCRGLLVRYDKKASNFLGLLQLACGLLWYRRVWRLTVLR